MSATPGEEAGRSRSAEAMMHKLFVVIAGSEKKPSRLFADDPTVEAIMLCRQWAKPAMPGRKVRSD
jgi:hypothetical protein